MSFERFNHFQEHTG